MWLGTHSGAASGRSPSSGMAEAAAAAATGSMDTASGFLGKLVSVRYTLTAELGEQTLEADVFAIDRALRRLVFRRSHAHTWMKADYFFLPASSISEITVRGLCGRA